jgi:hypothetical protein
LLSLDVFWSASSSLLLSLIASFALWFAIAKSKSLFLFSSNCLFTASVAASLSPSLLLN